MKTSHGLLVVLFLLFYFSEVTSLPRFALRENRSCIDCHVNPTGGIIRNRSGWSYSKNMMAMVSPRSDFEMNNKISENIQFGFDVRGQFLLQMTDSTKKTDFQRMNGSLYTSIDLSEDISFVARYDFIQNIWEGYGVAQLIPEVFYVKGGAFSPNFGIRIDDHTAYTRGGDLGLLFTTGSKQGLIYTPMYVESGAEVGVNIYDQAFLTASVGNASSQLFIKDPSFTANLKITPTISDEIGLFVGGSLGIYRDKRSSSPPKFQQIFPQVRMYGGYFGFGFENFTLMSEYDFADDYLVSDTKSAFFMLEASYRIFKGLDAVFRFDKFDPSTKSNGDDLNRYIIGFEFFPYSFVEIRPQYRFQVETPSIKNDAALIQIHFWY